mgnify:CR=1 FL=1
MNNKVLLGMSGGVDSSVSAILLQKKGYEVIGTTLELLKSKSCCDMDVSLEAKKVCDDIGIPHYTYNYENEFKKYCSNNLELKVVKIQEPLYFSRQSGNSTTHMGNR